MTAAADNERKIDRHRALALRAVQWWLGEMHSLCHDIAGGLGGGVRSAVTIEAGERYWMLRRRQALLGQVDRSAADADERRRSLRHLGAMARRYGAPVVEIPPERALARRITLPAPAQGALAGILHFEIARHFPFPAERVYFRHRVVARHDAGGAGHGTIEVEIVAVPRDIVAAICAELADAGVEPAAIAVAGAAEGAPLRLPVPAFGRGLRLTWGERALAAMLAVLAIAAVAAPVAHDRWRLAATQSAIAVLEPKVEYAAHARARTQQEFQRVAGPLRLEASRPPLVAVLDALTRAVPDGSWLQSLSLNGRELMLDGFSPSAATIALALAKNPAFANVVFRAPIARDRSSGLEHFRLSAVIAEHTGERKP